MLNTIFGPEPDEGDLWDIQMQEEYALYKENCKCPEDECICLSLSSFKKEKLKDLENYWEDLENQYKEDVYIWN